MATGYVSIFVLHQAGLLPEAVHRESVQVQAQLQVQLQAQQRWQAPAEARPD